MRKNIYPKRLSQLMALLLIPVFCFNLPVNVFGQTPGLVTPLNLPKPGEMICLTPAFNPPLIKGIQISPTNPLRLDFIVSSGQMKLSKDTLNDETNKFARYFLAGLTTPSKDLWVNLSPYEENRIIAKDFGNTQMGCDLLAQDYILKQLTASLTYPESSLGKQYWQKIYAKIAKLFGTTKIPVDNFNKIWIVPDKAVVFEDKVNAYVVESRIRVMLEEDYFAMQQKTGVRGQRPEASPPRRFTAGEVSPKSKILAERQKIEDRKIEGAKQVALETMRKTILPEIEKEINQGANFTQLRQIYNALILATWYKQKFKQSLLAKIYVDSDKITGVDTDTNLNKTIYNQYVEAFKKGVYDYIRVDAEPNKWQKIKRRYFSGGANFKVLNNTLTVYESLDQLTRDQFIELLRSQHNINQVMLQEAFNRFSLVDQQTIITAVRSDDQEALLVSVDLLTQWQKEERLVTAQTKGLRTVPGKSVSADKINAAVNAAMGKVESGLFFPQSMNPSYIGEKPKDHIEFGIGHFGRRIGRQIGEWMKKSGQKIVMGWPNSEPDAFLCSYNANSENALIPLTDPLDLVDEGFITREELQGIVPEYLKALAQGDYQFRRIGPGVITRQHFKIKNLELENWLHLPTPSFTNEELGYIFNALIEHGYIVPIYKANRELDEYGEYYITDKFVNWASDLEFKEIFQRFRDVGNTFQEWKIFHISLLLTKAIYEPVKQMIDKIFDKVYQNTLSGRGNQTVLKKLAGFEQDQEHFWWLNDYAIFTVMSNEFKKGWTDWDEQYRTHNQDAINKYAQGHADEIKRVKQRVLLNYYFFNEYKSILNSFGIKVAGDLAYAPGVGSSDIWANQRFFYLDAKGNKTLFTGAPPDMYSADGQVWGPPVFNWNVDGAVDYQVRRWKWLLWLYNIGRGDHEIGWAEPWVIYPVDKTEVKVESGVSITTHVSEVKATNGYRMQTKINEVFAILRKIYPDLDERISPEDLGSPTELSAKFMKDFGLPGMKVLQFIQFSDGFPQARDSVSSVFEFGPDSSVWPSVHDSPLSRKFFQEQILKNKNALKIFKIYLRLTGVMEEINQQNIAEILNRLAADSAANRVFYLMQEIIRAEDGARGQIEERLNEPGTTHGGNWLRRLLPEDFNDENAEYLLINTLLSNRLGPRRLYRFPTINSYSDEAQYALALLRANSQTEKLAELLSAMLNKNLIRMCPLGNGVVSALYSSEYDNQTYLLISNSREMISQGFLSVEQRVTSIINGLLELAGSLGIDVDRDSFNINNIYDTIRSSNVIRGMTLNYIAHSPNIETIITRMGQLLSGNYYNYLSPLWTKAWQDEEGRSQDRHEIIYQIFARHPELNELIRSGLVPYINDLMPGIIRMLDTHYGVPPYIGENAYHEFLSYVLSDKIICNGKNYIFLHSISQNIQADLERINRSRRYTASVNQNEDRKVVYTFTDKATKHQFNLQPRNFKVISWQVDGSERLNGDAFQGVSVEFPFTGRVENGKYQLKGELKQINKLDAEGNALGGLIQDCDFTIEKIDFSPQGLFVTGSLNTAHFPQITGYWGNAKIFITCVLNEDLPYDIDFQNIDDTPLPLSARLHPWFKVDPDKSKVKVALPAKKVLSLKPSSSAFKIPDKLVNVTAELDLSQGKNLTGEFDHTYSDITPDEDNFVGIQILDSNLPLPRTWHHVNPERIDTSVFYSKEDCPYWEYLSVELNRDELIQFVDRDDYILVTIEKFNHVAPDGVIDRNSQHITSRTIARIFNEKYWTAIIDDADSDSLLLVSADAKVFPYCGIWDGWNGNLSIEPGTDAPNAVNREDGQWLSPNAHKNGRVIFRYIKKDSEEAKRLVKGGADFSQLYLNLQTKGSLSSNILSNNQGFYFEELDLFSGFLPAVSGSKKITNNILPSLKLTKNQQN